MYKITLEFDSIHELESILCYSERMKSMQAAQENCKVPVDTLAQTKSAYDRIAAGDPTVIEELSKPLFIKSKLLKKIARRKQPS